MRIAAGLVAALAVVAALVPAADRQRPLPEWYHEACAAIDGEDDPC